MVDIIKEGLEAQKKALDENQNALPKHLRIKRAAYNAAELFGLEVNDEEWNSLETAEQHYKEDDNGKL